MTEGQYIVVLCREVNVRSGAVAVYEIKEPVTDNLLAKLRLRALANPELRYFVTARIRWEGVWHDDYYRLLKRRKLTEEDLQRMGGIVEVK